MHQRPEQMPPVFGGSGSDSGSLPDQKPETLPPVFGGSPSGSAPPVERDLTLPPVI